MKTAQKKHLLIRWKYICIEDESISKGSSAKVMKRESHEEYGEV